MLFMTMVVNSTLLLLARSASTALLAATSWRYVATYYVSDHLIYLTQKVARGDWWHWVPIEGAAGYLMTPVNRILLKLITDFTGVVQFRAAGELGGKRPQGKREGQTQHANSLRRAGCYWSLSMVSALLMPLAAVSIYFQKTVDDAAFSEGFAWAVAAGSSCAWILFFAIFLRLMKPKCVGERSAAPAEREPPIPTPRHPSRASASPR